MEFRQLRHFLAVYQHGTYGAAAESLNLTQQAVSASVAKLEASIGATLFDRDKSGTTPTKAAEILLPFARLIFADADRALEALAWHEGEKTGTLHFGVSHQPPDGAIPRAIRSMQQERPGIILTLVDGLITDLTERTLHGELDFMIIAPPAGWNHDPHLEIEKLFEARPGVACAVSHPLASRNTVTLADLSGYPWILPPAQSIFKDVVSNAFLAEGLDPPTRVIHSNSYLIGSALLSHGEHLVLIYTGLIDTDTKSGMFKTLPIDIAGPVAQGIIAYRKDSILDEPVKHFIGLIKQEVASIA